MSKSSASGRKSSSSKRRRQFAVGDASRVNGPLAQPTSSSSSIQTYITGAVTVRGRHHSLRRPHLYSTCPTTSSGPSCPRRTPRNNEDKAATSSSSVVFRDELTGRRRRRKLCGVLGGNASKETRATADVQSTQGALDRVIDGFLELFQRSRAYSRHRRLSLLSCRTSKEHRKEGSWLKKTEPYFFPEPFTAVSVCGPTVKTREITRNASFFRRVVSEPYESDDDERRPAPAVEDPPAPPQQQQPVEDLPPSSPPQQQQQLTRGRRHAEGGERDPRRNPALNTGLPVYLRRDFIVGGSTGSRRGRR